MLTWSNERAGGTWLRGYYTPKAGWSFEDTVARLKSLSKLDPNDGCDFEKVSVEFTGRFNGELFTLYDYKGGRSLHVGGRDHLNVDALSAALDTALAAVPPAPYTAGFHSDEYWVSHGWPVA